ncbi:diaminopropionate ammonia-lyase, putative [Talaromyces stipitatus ATCC 10500]|uniref:Diaminopropionate ammonia-lyase, putative n=1 Tax=Talaromyces stipitatus (strain ATCC 10500 / CBS 375.48 / QM 6759 / NRRL 1006) TaxID=441959 RepID=B8MI15_TALSN|nr:diaminopropionate ammonia-lyase, putative [Talaromyces stipitatus ATCC 10500]EED17177.1 diaminopropionate ammonia-lyase, putative [Talaromyces stipitatus ATCC 10500]
MSANRRPVLFQESTISKRPAHLNPSRVKEFHGRLPNYAPTRLIDLPGLARELNVKNVLVKDESSRFGLPSFKILGASWGTFTAIRSVLNLPEDSSLEYVSKEAAKCNLKLFAATDGNHGRAVARMAQLLSLQACVYVPLNIENHAKQLICNEGARIIIYDGDYDGAVQAAAKAAKATTNGVLIQDTSFPGYENIPAAITQGYSTIFEEIDHDLQLLGLSGSVVVSPVGVGSLAHACVQHYKTSSTTDATKVVTVEPDTAACFYKSFQTKNAEKISTSNTIMTGMNCGTVSHAAWQDLIHLVDASLTVSDYEVHRAVQYLRFHGVSSGPCGATGVAALRRLNLEDRAKLGLNLESVIVLLNTEGERPYNFPLDVSTDDPVELTRLLTRIESTNPTLSSSKGTGETQIANFIEAWLQHRDIETRRFESTPGRPSVVGIASGRGGGSNLMLNGHMDTVGLSSYSLRPLSGDLVIRDGREVITGRGCLDMKSGLAAAMTALLKASRLTLKGSVILAAVADEEDRSKGTEEVLAAGLRVDGAIVMECTMLPLGALGTGHKGFLWLEIEVLGHAAHGSDTANGVDAILNTGLLLKALRGYSKTLPSDEFLGPASLHCGIIKGGLELSTYPETCSLQIEFRTVPGQSVESITIDIDRLLAEIAEKEPQFRFNRPRVAFSRPAYKLDSGHPFERLAVKAAQTACEEIVTPTGLAFWCDAALLAANGIPTVVFGPIGQGAHGAEEWVDVESIRKTEKMINSLVAEFCG